MSHDENQTSSGSPEELATNLGTETDYVRLTEILQAAGVSQEGIQYVASQPAVAALVVKNKGLASFFARRFPSAATSTYFAAEQEYGFTDQLLPYSTNFQMADAAASGNVPALTNDTLGAVRLPNGVIIRTDPSTGEQQVLYPPDDPTIAGSPQWIRTKLNTWDKKTKEKWAERLDKHGYNSSDMMSGLRDFYWDKYLGNPKPSEGGSASKPVAPDRAEVRNSVRLQFRQVFGDDPNDDELSQWESFVTKTAMKLQRKRGYTPEYAATAAEERFIEKFESKPDVAWAMEHNEDIQENRQLRDSLVSLAQMIGGRS